MKHLLSTSYPVGGGPIILVPADRFVVRRIPIDPAVEVEEQVELAIESFAPLPLAQLYWGYLSAPEHGQALVWIACRRHFLPKETTTWSNAAAVLPALLLVARRARAVSALVIHRDATCSQAALWADGSPLPSALLTRAAAGEHEITGEIQKRGGLDVADPQCIKGPVEAYPRRKEQACEIKVAEFSTSYLWSELASCDIRDRGELAGLRHTIHRARLLWSASVAAAVLIMLAAGLDLARFVAGIGLDRLDTKIHARGAAVAEVQAAHSLSQRLAQLSQQRLHFMEMLDVLNERRPAGLLFVRVVSRGPHGLEVSARTQNADEARQFDASLKGAAGLSSVTLGNLSTRDGHTDFTLQAEFRAEAFGSDLGIP